MLVLHAGLHFRVFWALQEGCKCNILHKLRCMSTCVCMRPLHDLHVMLLRAVGAQGDRFVHFELHRSIMLCPASSHGGGWDVPRLLQCYVLFRGCCCERVVADVLFNMLRVCGCRCARCMATPQSPHRVRSRRAQETRLAFMSYACKL
jgi:hypothetical protein